MNRKEILKLLALTSLWLFFGGAVYAAYFVAAWIVGKFSLLLIRKIYRIHYTNSLITKGTFYR